MKSLRQIIRESIQLAENAQRADKIYFNTGLLSPEVKRYILHVTGGDPYTKLITDIYYAMQQQSIRQGRWAIAAVLPNGTEEDPEEPGHLKSENDVLPIEDWKKIRAYHNQLKEYNKNVFPIKGININGVSDIWELIRALDQRATILDDLKKLPSIARDNMKNDFRKLRDSAELRDYRSEFENFLAYYSLLGNRDPKFRKSIENKMFVKNVTLDDLIRFVEEKENLVGGRKFTKASVRQIVNDNDYDMEIVYNKGNVMVVDVTSPDAIKKIGCNSLWCFTYGKGFDMAYSQWNQYSTNDHVYVIIDFSVPTDSPEFMHVLIKPLDYNAESEEENDSKLFNMANEESYNAVGVVNHLVGDQAPFMMHFDEPVNVEGPSSKWPYEDPNQMKLDLKEVRRLVRQLFNEIELKSKSDKGNRYFEMLTTAKFQHYDSPKGELSTFYKGEEDRKRLVSKLSQEDKKTYREWLKTPAGQQSIERFEKYKTSE